MLQNSNPIILFILIGLVVLQCSGQIITQRAEQQQLQVIQQNIRISPNLQQVAKNEDRLNSQNLGKPVVNKQETATQQQQIEQPAKKWAPAPKIQQIGVNSEHSCVINTNYNTSNNNNDRTANRLLLKYEQHGGDYYIINNLDYERYFQKYKQDRVLGQGLTIEEMQYRRHVFNHNVQIILSHNTKQSPYKMGLNQYSDLSNQQFTQLFTNSLPVSNHRRVSNPKRYLNQQSSQQQQQNLSTNLHVDWRCHSTKVHEQGKCNSCYAITALDVLQINLRIRNVFPIHEGSSLSIQQILSCAKDDMVLLGCKGGYFQDVYQYVSKFGIGLDKYYQYSQEAYAFGKQIQCNRSLIEKEQYKRRKYFVKGYQKLKGSCNKILHILQNQTLVVSIFSDGLKNYKEGIFTPQFQQNLPESSLNKFPDHGVTLLGFHPSTKYMVKNSWGTRWGMGGYAHVAQQSGVCQYAVYPLFN